MEGWQSMRNMTCSLEATHSCTRTSRLAQIDCSTGGAKLALVSALGRAKRNLLGVLLLLILALKVLTMLFVHVSARALAMAHTLLSLLR